MPPENMAPTPPPITTSPQQKGSSNALAGLLILLLVLILAAYVAFSTGLFSATAEAGSVSVLVRDANGSSSSVNDYDLASGALTARTDVDPASVSSESAKIFILANGGYITLGTSGIVLKNDTTKTEQLLVATARAPLPRTPLAVWQDGARVAWVNPSDRSVQVFERTPQGTYEPLYLGRDILVNSLGFTTDGSALVLAKIGPESTEFYAVDLETGMIKNLRTLTGLASIIPTL